MGVTARLALGAMLLALAPSCFWVTTKHEGRVMRDQIKDLDGRLKGQEDILEGRVKALDESIDKATKILARNSADLGTQVDKFSQEMAIFAGRLETLQRTFDAARTEIAQVKAQQQELVTRLETIERQLGIVPGGPLPPSVDKETLYTGAMAKFQAGQFADARRELRVFLQAFPTDEKAGEVAFHVGETYVKDKEYEKAIAEFQHVVDAYPKSDYADDAFLQAGLAALEGKLCVESRAYLGELVRRYPKSPLVKQANQKLTYLKKNAKNKKVCKT